MKYVIKFIDENVKEELYSESDIHDLYHYLGTIGSPITLKDPSQKSHYFCTNTNTDTESLNPVIADPRGKKMIICGCFGRPGPCSINALKVKPTFSIIE